MSKADKQQVRWNLTAGIVAMAVMAVLVLAVAGAVVAGSTESEAKHYAVYVTNAGTLGTGDPVFMNGRKIGEVDHVELVNRDGAVQARIEFLIYEEHKDLNLPVDSQAVVVGPGLISGPRLVLNYGRANEVVEPNGEFTDAVSAESVDQIAGFAESARSLEVLIQELEATFLAPEFLSSVANSIAELRTTMDELNARAAEYGPTLEELKGSLDGTAENLTEVRLQLTADTRDLADQLNQLRDALRDGEASVEEIDERTSNAINELGRYQALSNEAAELSHDPQMKQLFLRVRWESASLAAQLENARYNPGAAGSEPGGQRVREHFNGGRRVLEKLGGDTDVNEFD